MTGSTALNRKSSQTSVPGTSNARLASLEKPGKLAALPAIATKQHKDKLRKILGTTADQVAEEIILNKKPKIGLTTRNSYQVPSKTSKSMQ